MLLLFSKIYPVFRILVLIFLVKFNNNKEYLSPKQAMLKVTEKKSGNRHESFVVGNDTFNQDVSRNELAKMIILHEYPIIMVNHIGFRNYSHSLQPLFKIVSRNSMKNDIMKLYESEKSKKMKILAKNKSCIAITTNMWIASNQNKGYMSVTAHYIDENWILFIYVPTPDTAEVICDFLVDCLMDWNIYRKLSTLTVNNCSTNDALIDHLIDKMSPSSFVLKGKLFHIRYCAHILNLIVKDGMQTISSSIEKIRESVGFWVATPKREEKFKETCNQLNMTYEKKLAQDC
ncbi:zinc finger BED domain-containing protein RICESLEEPER 2-like [Vicia villosa]|uniref:zinc finger BED domain-containing protein RICESLEEPER 2-like n=1 Tax=Vicia villosa TaxID=3911 RepID=UPI00273A8A8F|nr:zinc finger BED domain-containing protein RICESLEEPER 2-like [Vicia villosa]